MKNRRVLQAFAMVMQFGLNMIVPIVMCTLLGVWIGNRWNIPFITVPLFLAGAIAGFRNIFIMAKKIYQNDKKNMDKE
ncbi:MAG: AtpZ/AtpI family protein [Eubacterium sp.]|nr:AtpZ/AtpI family protein [Eubacterium sp.]